jgi:hypothetical protein
VLRTAWDGASEAHGFADALTSWSSGSPLVRVAVRGSAVTAAFTDVPQLLPTAGLTQK